MSPYPVTVVNHMTRGCGSNDLLITDHYWELHASGSVHPDDGLCRTVAPLGANGSNYDVSVDLFAVATERRRTDATVGVVFNVVNVDNLDFVLISLRWERRLYSRTSLVTHSHTDTLNLILFLQIDLVGSLPFCSRRPSVRKSSPCSQPAPCSHCSHLIHPFTPPAVHTPCLRSATTPSVNPLFAPNHSSHTTTQFPVFTPPPPHLLHNPAVFTPRPPHTTSAVHTRPLMFTNHCSHHSPIILLTSHPRIHPPCSHTAC